MIVGAYPFADPRDHLNFRKTILVSGKLNNLFKAIHHIDLSPDSCVRVNMLYILHVLWQRTLAACYSIPDNVRVSVECRDLLAKIFVAKPEKVT